MQRRIDNDNPKLCSEVNLGNKKYVRYHEEAYLYSVGKKGFTDLARKADAVRKIGGVSLDSFDFVVAKRILISQLRGFHISVNGSQAFSNSGMITFSFGIVTPFLVDERKQKKDTTPSISTRHECL